MSASAFLRADRRLGREDGLGTNRLVHWCGAQLQVRLALGLARLQVVGWVCSNGTAAMPSDPGHPRRAFLSSCPLLSSTLTAACASWGSCPSDTGSM